MSLPDVVSQEEWRAARVALLEREKRLTRERDALNADRRRVPLVEITKDSRFTGPDGEVTLLDLFDGRRQLIVSHFMFDPEWTDGCASCTAGTDEMSDGLLAHLHARDTTMVWGSRAPFAKLADYRARKAWAIPWSSSHGSDLNHHSHVTLDSP